MSYLKLHFVLVADTNSIDRVTNESSFCPPESSFLRPHRPSRQPSTSGNVQPPTSRPLSSADEAGPVPKKMRSTVRQPTKSMPTKQSSEEPLKKARARPALKFANFFSSSGRRSQPTTSSRATSTGLGKNDRIPSNSTIATRRSIRLLTGNGNKQSSKVSDFYKYILNHAMMQLFTTQHLPTRDRRRQPTHIRSRSTESELDEDTGGEVAFSLSPPSIAHSPRSELSPAPSNWTAAAAQETYELELAEQYIYDLMRQFASATRALSLYDCSKCIAELEKLPHVHQMSAGVLAMVGRAHYERLEYASVCSSSCS